MRLRHHGELHHSAIHGTIGKVCGIKDRRDFNINARIQGRIRHSIVGDCSSIILDEVVEVRTRNEAGKVRLVISVKPAEEEIVGVKIGNVEVHGWNLVHRTTLNIIKFKKYQHVFNLIESFAKELNLVDNDLLNELLEFQKNYVIDYDDIHLFPQIKQFNYDFLGYIQNEGELNKPLEYKFEFQDRTDITLDGFLENIYFGRKRNFGKALVTKLQNNILDNPVMNLLLLD